MAHIYHGSNELILTSANKRSFDSGLNRVDCVFKCRTTTADDFSILLTSGAIMPGFDDYIIKDPATKETGSDGFTTFTVSGFYGTLALSSGTSSVPSVIGANVNDFNTTVEIIYLGEDEQITTPYIYVCNFKILSDTLTQTFTLPTTESITSLELPDVNLNYVISYASFSTDTGTPIQYTYDFSKTIAQNAGIIYLNTLNARGNRPNLVFVSSLTSDLIDGDTTIINISRSNFGNVDEAMVTWGQVFRVPSVIRIISDES